MACEDVLGTDQYIAQEAADSFRTERVYVSLSIKLLKQLSYECLLQAYDGNYSAASDIFAVGVIGYRSAAQK